MDPQLQQQISAYHDGELPADQARDVERHLAADPEAAAELARLQQMSTRLRSAGPGPINPTFLAQLHERADDTMTAPVARITRWLTAAAAAVLLACSLTLYFENDASSDAPADPLPAWAFQSSSSSDDIDPETRITEWIVSSLD